MATCAVAGESSAYLGVGINMLYLSELWQKAPPPKFLKIKNYPNRDIPAVVIFIEFTQKLKNLEI